MAGNLYSEIHLHVVWHTKLSRPQLTPPVANVVHQHLKHMLVHERGLYVHEIGGIETHVHLALSITPTIQISELVGRLKGASAHETNQKIGAGRKCLEWQSGYGVVSFGSKDLDWVVAYVRNQPEHHARGTVHERLERIAPLVAEAEQREGS